MGHGFDATLLQAVPACIEAATGEPCTVTGYTAVAGGCINRGYRLDSANRPYFVKLNEAACRPMFEAEADGLRAIAQTRTVRVPMPVCTGADRQHAWLVLEYLALGRTTPGAMARLGLRLAAQHRSTAARFGWHRDNTIGATPQHNSWCDSWMEFWRSRRLGVQLDLAARQGYRGELQRQGEGLMARLDALLAHHDPVPSLLHGDLWGGNAGATEDGEPVVFDPACYYGDREADLAMSELFGGFAPSFRAAYRDAWPLSDGYPVRRDLYNLYHVLNHLNLFGGAYLTQAQAMIGRLLSELR